MRRRAFAALAAASLLVTPVLQATTASAVKPAKQEKVKEKVKEKPNKKTRH